MGLQLLHSGNSEPLTVGLDHSLAIVQEQDRRASEMLSRFRNAAQSLMTGLAL